VVVVSNNLKTSGDLLVHANKEKRKVVIKKSKKKLYFILLCIS